MSNISIITDHWKQQFSEFETPYFYAHSAEIYAQFLPKEKVLKTTIEIFDNKKNVVIKCYTTSFGMEMVQPDFEDQNSRWTEQDFSPLTQPIIFNKDIGEIYLNNCGTENWYEIIIYPIETYDDKIATICVKTFNYSI